MKKTLLLTFIIIFALYSFGQEAKEEKTTKPKLSGSALIQTDLIYDGKQMDPDWIGGFRPSKIPIYVDDPGWGSNGKTYFSIRQSTFKLDGLLPTKHKWGDIKLHFSFDFFGMGVHAGETSLRIRLAHGIWGPLIIGKEWSTFIDLGAFPDNWDWWGPSGMALLTSTMVRYTLDINTHHSLEMAIEMPGSEIDAGHIREIDPTLINFKTKEILPDLITRYSYHGESGHIKAALLLRQLTYEILSQQNDTVVIKNKFAWALNLTSVIKMFKKHGVLRLQSVFGNGYAGYNNDGGVEITPDENLRATIKFQYGFVAGFDYYIKDRWTTSLVYSETNQENSVGQLSDAFHRSQYLVGQVIYDIVPDTFMVGLSYQWGKRYNKNLDSADDYRVMLSARYFLNWKP
jgi:hypothetical protein